MATSEETQFALGVLAVIIVGLLGTLVFNFTSDTESTREKPAQASRQKSEQPRTSKSAQINGSSRPEEPLAQPVALATEAATTSNLPALQSALTVTQPGPAVPVIEPVPLAYFDSPSGAVQTPDVIQKYRDRVARGDLFMTRLGMIVAGTSSVRRDEQRYLEMEFTARSQSKRLSYKSVHTTEWIEATFNSSVSPATRDVLVDVRRVGDTAAEGERIALFFASIQDYADRRGFAMNADIGENDAILLVYALTDELTQLGEARLVPSEILER
ncbi:MAG: hypothetical protein AB8B63_11450 [Granulosicoccus sp.]